MNIERWKTIIFFIILIVWGVYHYTATQRSLGDDAKQLIRAWISSEYLISAMQNQNKPIEKMTEKEMEKYGKVLLKLQDVVITSLKARGRGGNVIARVEFCINGGTPFEGKSVRYFKIKYRSACGWQMEHETDAISYYLKIW